MKDFLRHAKVPNMTLLSYHAMPLAWCGLSPAELLMGRKIRTTVPQPMNAFIPTWTHIQNLSKVHQSYKSKQDDYYNRQHRVKSLPTLPDKCGCKQRIHKYQVLLINKLQHQDRT